MVVSIILIISPAIAGNIGQAKAHNDRKKCNVDQTAECSNNDNDTTPFLLPFPWIERDS